MAGRTRDLVVRTDDEFAMPNDRPFSLTRTTPDELAEEADLPPVVARLVVEIRSDGTRTIARGALEDRVTGERVALRADAQSPIALARELTKALLLTPVLAKEAAKEAVRSLLPRALGRRR